MRRRAREYELPEGAHAPEEAAATIVADFKRQQRARTYTRFATRRPTTRVEIYDVGGPEVMAERLAQGALLDRVRAGDADAARELRERFGAWIVGREAR